MQSENKGEEHHPPFNRKLVSFLSLLCVIIIIVHIVASPFSKGRIWGFNQWSYFSPVTSLLMGTFVLLFFSSFLNEWGRKTISYLAAPFFRLAQRISKLDKKNKYLVYFILSFPFIIPFWLLRDQTHFLGDGASIISSLNSGNLAIKWSEPLEIFIHLKVFDFAHRLWGMDAADVYAVLSCLAGILFVFLVFLLADFWGKKRGEKVLIFFILLSMGSSQLFFGYAEHYSFLYVFIFAFILSSLGYLNGRVRWFFPLAAFFAASLSHLSSVYLLPSLLFLFVVKIKDKKLLSLKRILILGMGLAFIGFALVAYRKYGWTLPPVFVPLFEDRYIAPGYLLLSLPHVLDFLNQQLLIAPMGLIMILVPLACRTNQSFLKDRIFLFLLLLSICQLLYNFLVDPCLGASRDWDMFSSVGLGYTILGLFIFLRLFRDKAGFEYLSIILVLCSLYSAVPWIVLNSNEQKSITRFQNLLEIDEKRSSNGHFVLIKYFEDHEMEKEAEKQREKYRQAFPERVLLMQATHLMETGELDRAEDLLLQAEKLAPKLSEIHNNLGYLYLQRGELEKAEAKLKKAVQLVPPVLSSPYVHLVDIYLMRQEYDLALDACKKAIQLKAKYPEIYSNAATIYLIKGELEKARNYYKEALSKNPRFVDAYVGLGDVYNKQSLPREAIKMYRIAVELDPHIAKAHLRLGMTYLSINSMEKAKEELEMYLRISPRGKDAQKAMEVLDKLR
jgi:tetratricopeptide (TPR) repeat protein